MYKEVLLGGMIWQNTPLQFIQVTQSRNGFHELWHQNFSLFVLGLTVKVCSVLIEQIEGFSENTKTGYQIGKSQVYGIPHDLESSFAQ